MKIKYALFLAGLVTVLTIILLGQTKQNVNTKTVTKKNDISSVIGKPVFQSTVDSLQTKVWILTQRNYKKLINTNMGEMMVKMKDKNTRMNKATKEAMMDSTHYFIFDVTNITSRKEIADTSAKVEIVSPSKKISSVNLHPMMNHFGSGISLVEKGDYLFTINLNVGAGYKTTQFKHKIK